MDKIPLPALAAKIDAAKQQMPLGSKWLHYKGGRYIILDYVILEASNEVGVVYGPLDYPGVKFLRPLVVWQDVIDWEGKKIFRFRSVG